MTNPFDQETEQETALEPLKIPDGVPLAKHADYQRGMALLVNIMHEKDLALGELNLTKKQLQDAQNDVSAKTAQIDALKNMLIFAEQQNKVREAEYRTSVTTYQQERDELSNRLAESEARLNLITETVLTSLRERGQELADRQAKNGNNRQ
jgi:hypothetical protein